MWTTPSALSGEHAEYLPWAVDPDEVPDDVREIVLGARDGSERRRVLTTVLFTDIVGSTELASSLGDRRYRDLLEAHNALVRRELVRFGGREVDLAGDGFVATFDGPTDAISCAQASVASVRWIGVDLRAGVHTGECELVGGKPSGIAMNIGARIGALAGAGEVLVSSTVRELVAGSEHGFADHGTHELRGVPGGWTLYRVA